MIRTVVGIIACCMLLVTNSAPINLDKLSVQHLTLYNDTAQSIHVTLNVRYNTQEAKNIIAEMSFVMPAHEEFTFHQPKYFPQAIDTVQILSLDEVTRLCTLTYERHQAHNWSIHFKPQQQPSFASFSFVPPLVDFRSGLKINDTMYHDCIKGVSNYTKSTEPRTTQELMDFLKNQYEKNHPLKCTPSTEPRIPKIIHHIWLGSKLPENLLEWFETFMHHHPDWDHILWTDQTEVQAQRFVTQFPRYKEVHISALGTLRNQQLIDESKNYGERSDIMRYEILNRYGGCYVDIDFQCFEKLDILHHCYDFYSGVLPLDTGLFCVNNGLIGARAGHPILEASISMMQSSRNFNRHHYFAIILATGPIPFTRAVWKAANQENNIDIVFPCSYFYPLAYRKHGLERHVDMCPESFTVHYCTKTWARASAHAK